MAAENKIRVCHITSVHRVTDTRIYWKECLSLSPYYSVYLIAQGIPTSNNGKIQFIRLRATKKRLLRFLFTDWVLLVKAISVKARLYHFHDPELIPIALILKYIGKEIIYDVHENVSVDIDAKKWLPFKKSALRIYKWFENLAVKNFYLVLAEKSYENLYQGRTSKIAVVQNFARLDLLAPLSFRYNNQSKVLALLGNLSARRGLPFVLDALWLLKQKNIEIRLRCIGEVNADTLQILSDSVSYPDVKGQVEFMGYMGIGALVIADCLAGLALPETLPNHIESYPTKMFEYMAVGLPVICSDFLLYKDVVEKNNCGFSVCPEEPQAIADAIEKLIKNPETALEMSKNAREAVKQFNWKTEEAKLLDFYASILKQ